MNNELTIRINKLAHKIKEADFAEREKHYSELIPLTDLFFKQTRLSFLHGRDYKNILVDEGELYSAYNRAVMRATKNYCIFKGDFMARVSVFAKQEFTSIARREMAQQRYSTNLGAVPLEGLQDIATTTEKTGLEQHIYDFIKQDKEGKVIDILLHIEKREQRSQALSEYYGQYTERERKRVQRVRERLRSYLRTKEEPAA